MNIRLIVNFDIKAESLEDAYMKLMARLMPAVDLDIILETSDEFYIEGEQGDPEDLTNAIVAALKKQFVLGGAE